MRHLALATLVFGAGISCSALAHAELSTSVMALAKRCAPGVSPLTMAYVVAHESANNPFNLNVNDGNRLKHAPQTRAEALAIIREWQAEGRNFDVGLGMVNSANFSKLDTDAESLLDGCNNLQASSVVLRGCYEQAVRDHGEGQKALRHALSCYNTGSQTRGFGNGYVARIVAQANTLQVPALVATEGNGDVPDKDPSEEAGVSPVPSTPTRSLGTPDAFARNAQGDAFEQSEPDAFEAAARGNAGARPDESLPDTTKKTGGNR